MIRQQVINLTTGLNHLSQLPTYRTIAYASTALAVASALSYLMLLIIKGACYCLYYLLTF